MRNSADAIDEIKEIKNISGRRSIRGEGDNFIYDETLVSRKKAINNNEDRSISEPPQSLYNNHTATDSIRLKTIREKMDDNQCSSDDDEDYSKSNSQLNGSDLDLEIPESASQTPTPTPLMVGSARRINSETNLNDSKRRLTGFMGNRSKRFCASTSELSFSSHLDTNKSLFSPKNNRGSRTGSLYGSNISLNSSSNNSRLFMVNSPFYNGKTTFGGASAYPRKDINQHKILRNPVQMRPSSSLSNSSNTSTKSEGAGYMPESNAAKRILEIMTQFNGPLKETRNMGNNINSMIKIPGLVQNRKRFGEEELQLNRSIALTRPTAPYSRPIASATSAGTQNSQKNTPDSLATSLLNTSNASPQIPTMSQLLKMKRLQNNTERAREIANRSENFLNRVHEYKLPSSNEDFEKREGPMSMENSSSHYSSSSSLKMKNNITKNLLRNEKAVIDQPPEPLNLPNIQLPELKSYPKFDINLSVPSESNSIKSIPVTYANCFKTNSSSNTIVSSSPPTQQISSNTGAKLCSNENLSEMKSSLRPTTTTSTLTTTEKTSKDNFKFSMPIKIDAGVFDASKASTVDKFVFSKPLEIDEKENVNTNGSSDSKSLPQASSENLFKNLVDKQNSQWESSSCLNRNEHEKTKSLSCDTIKSSSETISESIETSKSAVASVPSDDLFKKLAAQQKKSQWECDACMTKNDLDKEKCLCCETPKPGSKPNPSSNASLISTPPSGGFKFGMPSSSTLVPSTEPIKPSDDLFKSLAAQQKKSQWECDACMTRNDFEKNKCVCCETPKPGSSVESKPQNAVSSSNFSFGIKPISTETTAKFSFGMPTSSSTSPSSSVSKSVDPTFKKIVEKQNSNWECSACMTRNEQSQSKCICCEQAKPGSSENQASFSFASKSVSLPPPTAVKFSFGVQPPSTDATVSKNSNEKDENQKKDEVDKPVSTGFSFGTFNSFSTTTTTTGFKFGDTAEIKATSSDAIATPSFTFKSPASNTISSSFTIPTPKAETKNKLTDENEENKPLKSCLGNPEMKSTDKKVSFNIDANKDTTDKSGGFSFSLATATGASSVSSASAPINFGNVNTITTPNTNGGITFGAFSKPTEETKLNDSIGSSTEVAKTSGGFQFISSTSNTAPGFSFGAKTPSATTVAESTTATQSTNLFSFGAPKSESSEPQKTFGSFSNAAPTSVAPISAFTPSATSMASTAPIFGASSSFVFGNAKKDENTAPSQIGSGFSFSSKPTNSNMVFGSNQNVAPSVTPVFGSSNPMPVFGSNSINNTTSNNNNNESGFGSKMNNFGSNQPQKRSFDFGSGVNMSSEGSQSKKFDFGSQQQSQANAAPFAFNAQLEQKPAFSFTANAPAFNFTANSITNSNPIVGNSQENLFQFGANSSSATTTQGIFAFGANPQQLQPQPQQPATAPPIMTFGATGPTVAIGGLNASFNPGIASGNPQRKILKANRRNNIRR